MRPLTVVEALFKAAESGFEKGGDLLREIAALLLVFLPLEWWKNELTWGRFGEVFAASVGIFLVGMVCHWTSLGVKRGRLVWEEEKEEKYGSNRNH